MRAGELLNREKVRNAPSFLTSARPLSAHQAWEWISTPPAGVHSYTHVHVSLPFEESCSAVFFSLFSSIAMSLTRLVYVISPSFLSLQDSFRVLPSKFADPIQKAHARSLFRTPPQKKSMCALPSRPSLSLSMRRIALADLSVLSEARCVTDYDRGAHPHSQTASFLSKRGVDFE